jgi:GAF domain-containing protein
MGSDEHPREGRTIDTFVELADTLASDYEVGELLQLLVDRCLEVLPADTVGVLLEAPAGGLWLAAATSEEMHDIEQAELATGEGPCVQAYRTGRPVIVPDLAECAADWPKVTPRLLDLGMRAGHAFPLQLRDVCIGALNLYRRDVGGFDEDDVRLAQALADIAAIGILQQRSLADAELLADQLQHALTSRIVIEQAKGVLAQRHHIAPEQAWEALRSYARSNGLRVHDLCQRVVEGVTEGIVSA